MNIILRFWCSLEYVNLSKILQVDFPWAHISVTLEQTYAIFRGDDHTFIGTGARGREREREKVFKFE